MQPYKNGEDVTASKVMFMLGELKGALAGIVKEQERQAECIQSLQVSRDNSSGGLRLLMWVAGFLGLPGIAGIIYWILR